MTDYYRDNADGALDLAEDLLARKTNLDEAPPGADEAAALRVLNMLVERYRIAAIAADYWHGAAMGWSRGPAPLSAWAPIATHPLALLSATLTHGRVDPEDLGVRASGKHGNPLADEGLTGTAVDGSSMHGDAIRSTTALARLREGALVAAPSLSPGRAAADDLGSTLLETLEALADAYGAARVAVAAARQTGGEEVLELGVAPLDPSLRERWILRARDALQLLRLAAHGADVPVARMQHALAELDDLELEAAYGSSGEAIFTPDADDQGEPDDDDLAQHAADLEELLADARALLRRWRDVTPAAYSSTVTQLRQETSGLLETILLTLPALSQAPVCGTVQPLTDRQRAIGLKPLLCNLDAHDSRIAHSWQVDDA